MTVKKRRCHEEGCKTQLETNSWYCENHKHGKPSNYARGCRCAECVAANVERGTRQRMARLSNKNADIPHGLGGYVNHGCRCDICKAAQSETNRAYRESRIVRMTAGLMPMETHGTSSGYRAWNCRCAACTKANTDQARNRRKARAKAV